MLRVEPLNFKELTGAGLSARPAAMKRFTSSGKPKEDVPPPPPPPPTYSADDLKAAEREGYKKGFSEGVTEGQNQAQSEQASIERQLSETAAQFVQQITPLFESYKHMMLEMKRDLPKVSMAIARKVAGDALAANAEAVVCDVALRCAESMLSEPRLLITVHGSLAATLEQKLGQLAQRLQAATQISVVADDALPTADCRIEWKHGAMQRNTAELWQQIEKAIAGLSAGAQRDTTMHMEQLQTQLPPAAS